MLCFSAFQRYRALYVPARRSDAPPRKEREYPTAVGLWRDSGTFYHMYYVLLYARRMYTFNLYFEIKNTFTFANKNERLNLFRTSVY